MDIAGIWDLIIEQGATLERYYRWEDSDGSPRSLTDYSLRMIIRATIGSTALATSLGGTPTITLSKPGAVGVIKVLISSVNTAALDFTRGVYDIEAFDTSSPVVVHRIVEGKVTLNKEITTA